MMHKPYSETKTSLNRSLCQALALGALLVAPLFLASCEKDSSRAPFGDQNSSERVLEEIERVRRTLAAPKDGWVLKNVPGPSMSYGGYTILVKFLEDGTAYAVGERDIIEDNIVWEKGFYEIRDDQGVVISFPNYLTPITYYADSDIGYAGGTGKGYEGDYDFIVQEIVSDKRIIVEGRTSTNKMELFVPDSGTPEDYLRDILAFRETASDFEALYAAKSNGWLGSIGGKELLLIPSPGFNRFVVADPSNPDMEQGMLSYFLGNNRVDIIWPFKVDPVTKQDDPMMSGSVLAPFKDVKSLSYDPETSVWTTDAGDKFVPHVDPEWDEYAKFLGDYLVQMPGLLVFKYFTLVPGPNHTYVAKTQYRQEDGVPYFDYDLQFNWVTHNVPDPETGEIKESYKTLRLTGQTIVAKGESYELVVVSKAGRILRGDRYGLDAVPAADRNGNPSMGLLGGGSWTFDDNGASPSDPILAIIPLKGSTPITEGIDPWMWLPSQTVLHKVPIKNK